MSQPRDSFYNKGKESLKINLRRWKLALKEYFRKLLFCFDMQLRKERRGIKRKVRGVKNVNSEEKSSSIYLYGSLYDISKNTVNRPPPPKNSLGSQYPKRNCDTGFWHNTTKISNPASFCCIKHIVLNYLEISKMYQRSLKIWITIILLTWVENRSAEF